MDGVHVDTDLKYKIFGQSLVRKGVIECSDVIMARMM